MARKARPVEYDYVDDLDGKPLPDDATPAKFTLGGTRYELDLSAANAKKLEKALVEIHRFIDVARVAGTPASRRTARSSASTTSAPRSVSRADLAQVRAWAKDNGYEVSNRGRIAQAVQDAYDAAQ